MKYSIDKKTLVNSIDETMTLKREIIFSDIQEFKEFKTKVKDSGDIDLYFKIKYDGYNFWLYLECEYRVEVWGEYKRLGSIFNNRVRLISKLVEKLIKKNER